MIGEFHARSGFYFKRLPDGTVRVRVTMESTDGSPTFRAIELPENEWASVVASVSGGGEDATTWQAARDFHAASQELHHTTDPRRETWLKAAGDAVYGLLVATPRELAEVAISAYETARDADESTTPQETRTMTYILYTYEAVDGQEVCHAYGPSTDKAALQQIGESMAKTPGVGFMVLELEAVPV